MKIFFDNLKGFNTLNCFDNDCSGLVAKFPLLMCGSKRNILESKCFSKIDPKRRLCPNMKKKPSALSASKRPPMSPKKSSNV